MLLFDSLVLRLLLGKCPLTHASESFENGFFVIEVLVFREEVVRHVHFLFYVARVYVEVGCCDWGAVVLQL